MAEGHRISIFTFFKTVLCILRRPGHLSTSLLLILKIWYDERSFVESNGIIDKSNFRVHAYINHHSVMITQCSYVPNCIFCLYLAIVPVTFSMFRILFPKMIELVVLNNVLCQFPCYTIVPLFSPIVLEEDNFALQAWRTPPDCYKDNRRVSSSSSLCACAAEIIEYT